MTSWHRLLKQFFQIDVSNSMDISTTIRTISEPFFFQSKEQQYAVIFRNIEYFTAVWTTNDLWIYWSPMNKNTKLLLFTSKCSKYHCPQNINIFPSSGAKFNIYKSQISKKTNTGQLPPTGLLLFVYRWGWFMVKLHNGV